MRSQKKWILTRAVFQINKWWTQIQNLTLNIMTSKAYRPHLLSIKLFNKINKLIHHRANLYNQLILFFNPKRWNLKPISYLFKIAITCSFIHNSKFQIHKRGFKKSNQINKIIVDLEKFNSLLISRLYKIFLLKTQMTFNKFWN